MAANTETSSDWTPKAMSHKGAAVFNPIRAIVDNMKTKPNPAKKVIALDIGDPTLCGNLNPPEIAITSLVARAQACKNNGYVHAAGTVEARSAIAQAFSYPECGMTPTHDDVVIGSGCSGALEIALTALGDAGDNILVPLPGFPLYETIAKLLGMEVRKYHLLPDQGWEADLGEMESLIDDRTRGVVVNNPSNPCGAVYSADHLRAILDIARRKKVVIIADEIYGGMVFSGCTYVPMATLADDVPIIHAGGLAKRFMMPGWRVGWVIVYDKNKVIDEVRKAMFKLSQIVIGSNTLAQSVVPDLLLRTPPEYHESNNRQIEGNATAIYDACLAVKGLKPCKPHGAMYMMVGIDKTVIDVRDDVHFSELLHEEESVRVLPGSCFGYPDFFRIVYTASFDLIEESGKRIGEFCARHSRP